MACRKEIVIFVKDSGPKDTARCSQPAGFGAKLDPVVKNLTFLVEDFQVHETDQLSSLIEKTHTPRNVGEFSFCSHCVAYAQPF